MSGVVSVGDSITVAGGPRVLGVPSRSWARWLAEALGLEHVNHAVNGSTTTTVIARQLPLLEGSHAIGTLLIGGNDIRTPSFDPAVYQRDVTAILAALAGHATTVLVLTNSLDLGRPRAAPKPAVANAVVRSVAASCGAVVCDLDDLAGWPAIWPDGVHPTALGQLEIADRAARALGRDVVPSARAGRVPRPGDRLRLAALHARSLAGDCKRRAAEGTLLVR
jgi:lysophospholipase L1-like esterase